MKLSLLLLFVSIAWADGGKVQFERKAGAFSITLFSTDSTVRIGRTDFSVMVQNAKDHSALLDATVNLHLVQRQGNTIVEVSAPARHDKAANKLLYAAQINLKATGKWRAEVSVQTPRDSALVTGEINVMPPEPPLLAHWPYFVALPVVALLFAVNQRLKRKRRAANPQSRP